MVIAPFRFFPACLSICPSTCLLLALPWLGQNALAAGAGANLDAKGRDIRLMAQEDSLNKVRSAQRESDRRKHMESFRESVRIDGAERDCVAYNPRTAACLVTLGEFNQSALGVQPPPMDSSRGMARSEEIDQARSRLLMMLLDEKYITEQVEHGEKKDSLDALFRRAEERQSEQLRKAIGDAKLRALYRMYRERLFSPREEAVFEVLAASDSGFADSLRRSLPVGENGTRLPAGPKVSTEPANLPWSRVPAEELPRQVIDKARAHGADSVVGPARTPYGFVLVRLASVRKIPATSYEKALPILANLMHVEPEANPSMDTAIALYYRRNKEAFLSPDTATFRAWLLPNFKRKAGHFARDIERSIKRRKPIEDTTRVEPATVPQSELPPETREKLEFFMPFERGELLGPIRTRLGTWYLQPVEIREGGRQLTLEEVRGKIRKLLFNMDLQDPVMAALNYGRQKQMGAQASIVAEYLRNRQMPSRQELEALGASGRLDSLMSGLPPDMPIAERKREAETAWSHQEAFTRSQDEKRRWMQGLVLNHVDLEKSQQASTR